MGIEKIGPWIIGMGFAIIFLVDLKILYSGFCDI
jgi:hypothetical protein